MDFEAAFQILKKVFGTVEKRLAIQRDSPVEYTLVTKSASPFPQHKGQPMYFGSVKMGKAYVSFHLMPLYMTDPKISPELKKRMQGKTCFNFKRAPDPGLLAELKKLTEAGIDSWAAKSWL